MTSAIESTAGVGYSELVAKVDNIACADPILGLVAVDLATIFKRSSQMTRNYPLVGGIGWGLRKSLCDIRRDHPDQNCTVRMNLLFKSVDAQLPQNVSGYEVATIRLEGIKGRRPSGWTTERLIVEIQSDCGTLELPYDQSIRLRRSESRDSVSSRRSSTSLRSQSSSRGLVLDTRPENLDWLLPLPAKHRVLAVEYRHSCFLLFRFYQDNGTLQKNLPLGIAVIRLASIADNAIFEADIPIYDTADTNEAVNWALDREASLERGENDPHGHLASIHITFKLFAGISKVHRRLAKGDRRFRHVVSSRGWHLHICLLIASIDSMKRGRWLESWVLRQSLLQPPIASKKFKTYGREEVSIPILATWTTMMRVLRRVRASRVRLQMSRRLVD